MLTNVFKYKWQECIIHHYAYFIIIIIKPFLTLHATFYLKIKTPSDLQYVSVKKKQKKQLQFLFTLTSLQISIFHFNVCNPQKTFSTKRQFSKYKEIMIDQVYEQHVKSLNNAENMSFTLMHEGIEGIT